MNKDLLWRTIKEEVEDLLLNDQVDREAIEDTLYLLLLKRKWFKDTGPLTLSNQRESRIVNQIEQLMEKEKSSFESVLTELNQTFY
ncbi:hypothetical protein BN1058_02734 [Paraliobacillus sp. PM-2]|uniref:hypothetical protein n=1 Tax=Paraliobacillus sp. PM-2 TaxID=1462524 RepID=UPI00061BC12A|nr:hypothetical protein [Paraliobacillus sp. PM-2]CQR48366.1 hypothetical protein BN1058_02734 [Paraliobacillus sp. PM-2]